MVADNLQNIATPRRHPMKLQQSDPEKYAYLRAEAIAPYRKFRQFFYAAFALSGGIGGLVFLAKLLAGRDLETTIPSLALQAGVVALMIFLYRRDQTAQDRLVDRVRDQEKIKKTP
jgi:Low psii accumulation1 / Rep27